MRLLAVDVWELRGVLAGYNAQDSDRTFEVLTMSDDRMRVVCRSAHVADQFATFAIIPVTESAPGAGIRVVVIPPTRYPNCRKKLAEEEFEHLFKFLEAREVKQEF